MYSESVAGNPADRRAKLQDLADVLDGCIPIASAEVLDEPAPTHVSVVLRPSFTWRGRALTGPVDNSEFGVTRVRPQGIHEQLYVRIE